MVKYVKRIWNEKRIPQREETCFYLQTINKLEYIEIK